MLLGGKNTGFKVSVAGEVAGRRPGAPVVCFRGSGSFGAQGSQGLEMEPDGGGLRRSGSSPSGWEQREKMET